MDEYADETMLEPAPESLALAAIRAVRAKAAERHVYDMDIPGYQGLLVIRCGPVGGTRSGQLRERWMNSKAPDKDTALNMDTILAACQEVLGRPSQMQPLQPIAPEPMIIDHHLADLLRLEIPAVEGADISAKPTGRQVLLALFSLAHDPELAIGVAGGEFMAWAASADEQVSEEALGES